MLLILQRLAPHKGDILWQHLWFTSPCFFVSKRAPQHPRCTNCGVKTCLLVPSMAHRVGKIHVCAVCIWLSPQVARPRGSRAPLSVPPVRARPLAMPTVKLKEVPRQFAPKASCLCQAARGLPQIFNRIRGHAASWHLSATSMPAIQAGIFTLHKLLSNPVACQDILAKPAAPQHRQLGSSKISKLNLFTATIENSQT